MNGAENMIKSYKEVLTGAKKMGGKRIAVAGAASEPVLDALKMAVEYSIAEPVLIGDKKKIQVLAQHTEFSVKDYEIIDLHNDEHIAEKAAELVAEGAVNGLMKGKVSTPIMLKAVLNKKFNLCDDRLLSHIALLELDSYPKLLMVTDGGMVIRPNLEQKVGILRNGIEMMAKLGVDTPKVAVLAAIEKVSPKMPETLDAEMLVQMALKGEFNNAVIEGPLAVDIVFSREAAEMKGVESEVSGDADILLVPDIACGNIFAKGLWHLAGARIGGLILGASCPVILLSRSDNAETKLNSIALGVVTS